MDIQEIAQSVINGVLETNEIDNLLKCTVDSISSAIKQAERMVIVNHAGTAVYCIAIDDDNEHWHDREAMFDLISSGLGLDIEHI